MIIPHGQSRDQSEAGVHAWKDSAGAQVLAEIDALVAIAAELVEVIVVVFVEWLDLLIAEVAEIVVAAEF